MGSGEGYMMRNFLDFVPFFYLGWGNLSRRLNWAGHVTWTEESNRCLKIFTGTSKVRDILEGLDVDGSIIIDWILKE